jgi:hypothetical protein
VLQARRQQDGESVSLLLHIIKDGLRMVFVQASFVPRTLDSVLPSAAESSSTLQM